MEAQLQRPAHGHHQYEEDPQITGGVEGEHDRHHGEKKSVMKKVKDKAKKLKDTITKHEHRQDHASEDDDEMVNDPEVHGAPIHDSPVVTGTSLPMQTGFNLEKPNDVREDRYNPNVRNQDQGYTTGLSPGKMETEFGNSPVEARREPEIMNPLQNPTKDDFEATRPFSQDIRDTELDRHPVKTAHHEPERKYPLQYPGILISHGMDESEPSAVETKDVKVEEPTVKIGPLTDLEKDTNFSLDIPSNYQSKVVDLTGQGGKEADVGPLARRLGHVHIQDKSESSPDVQARGLYTGSHDQFAPQPTPTEEEFEFNPDPNPLGVSQNPESPKIFDASSPESVPPDTITGKISSATHVIADKAISAKNAVASKLGYGGQQSQHEEEGQEISSRRPESPTMIGTGSTILSKVQEGGGAVEVEHEGGDEVVKGADKGVSVKEYLAVKLRPGDEDKALSEVITEALQRKKEGVPKTGVEQRGTEAEDVAAGSGTGRENRREREDEVVAGSENSGGGVVDRLKGWLGKGTESARSRGIEHRGEEVGSQQRRLQESGS